MRVIAGTAKGLRLATPSRKTPVRPIDDRVKEALFSILFDLQGLRILDCFAGTGAVGIEALSRGAQHATFIDNLGEAIAVIEENLRRCHMQDRATVLRMPVDRGLRLVRTRGATYDIIFVDPPYNKHLVNPTLARIVEYQLLRTAHSAERRAKPGRIVIEHCPQEPLALPPTLALTDQRKYGQTTISFVQAST